MKYRKKPVIIEAIEWTGTNYEELFELGMDRRTTWVVQGECPIPTLEGTMKAKIGDYIIKGVQGEFYPCKPDIFAATYEKVEE